MSFRLGLTGGIGMGKSTAAQMFRDLGHPVWDADAAVHRLYAPGGDAVAPVAAAFPGVLKDGGIDRAALRLVLADSPDGFQTLERIVHPLVAADRAAFIARHDAAPIVVLRTVLTAADGGAVEILDFCPRHLKHSRIYRPIAFARVMRPLSGAPRVTKISTRLAFCESFTSVASLGRAPASSSALEPRQRFCSPFCL